MATFRSTLAAGGRLLAFALCPLLAAPAALRAAPRVVIVGVDGASWSVLDPLLAEG